MGLTLLIPPSLGHHQTSTLTRTLADGLGKRLQLTIAVEVARTYDEIEARAISGEAALVWAPPSVCARAFGTARMILKATRGGHPTYCAALFCRSDALVDLDELKGVRAGWVDPLSAAGYLLPRQYLRERGVDPDARLVSQRCFGSFGDAARSVVQGDSDLSAIFTHSKDSTVALANLATLVGDAAAQLRVIAITAETASDGLIIGAGVSELVANRLIESLLAPDDDGSDLVRRVFAAQTLMVAAPGDYTAILQALKNEE